MFGSDIHGAVIDKINSRLRLKNTVLLSDFDTKNGLKLPQGYILLDETITESTDFTLFMSIKHDSSMSNLNGIGFGDQYNIFNPYLRIEKLKFVLYGSSPSGIYKEDLLSAYHDKQLCFWFCKTGNIYKVGLCSGTQNIFKTITNVNSFSTNRINIWLPHYIQRIGFSTNFYDLNGREFHKLLFQEKLAGTYFI